MTVSFPALQANPNCCVVHVKRIRICGDLDESPRVVVRESLAEAGVLERLEVFDSRDDWRRSQ
jgi:hypothetical protein